MPDRNIASMRKLIELGFGTGDLSVVDELVAADCREHQRGLKPGREGVKETIRTLRSWFSDFEISVAEITSSGETVWTRNRARGTSTGSVMGRPPTGKRFEIDVFDVGRFEDGVLVEHWGVADQLGMMLETGLLPSPPRPVAAQ